MKHKFFPIKTDTACQSKWTWSTIRLYDGTTSSCHRVDPEKISIENFSNFHNTPLKLADREKMLQGQWPGRGCEYCKDIEDVGGFSDRLQHLSIPYLHPPELDDNKSAIVVTPRIVEVYFDNICNMRCIYCWDGFSSKIHQENKKFGRFEKNGVVIDNHSSQILHQKEMTLEFWRWMSTNACNLRRFHVLGGEPFYQPQFEECLNFLENNPCPALEFSVITNLKIETSKLESLLSRIKILQDQKHIRRFDLTSSIDCWGVEQEYVRYGINMDQWKTNFELVAKNQWIYLNINQTLSSLTIKTVPELLDFVNILRQDREINHFFSPTLMTYPSDFLHPGIFGPGFFEKDFEIILGKMPDTTHQYQQSKKYMIGITKQIGSSVRDNEKIKKMVIYLDEIDRRRKLDWKKTFSWLAKEIEHVV